MKTVSKKLAPCFLRGWLIVVITMLYHPAAKSDEQGLYNKTYFLWFKSPLGKLYSNRFYISNSGTIYGYSNSPGGCANTGSFTKLNSTNVNTVNCQVDAQSKPLRLTDTAHSQVIGNTVIFETTSVGEGWTHNWKYSLSYNGNECKIVDFKFDGKDNGSLPVSCEVKLGNAAGQ